MVYNGIRNRTEGHGIVECNSKAMANAIYYGKPQAKGEWNTHDVVKILASGKVLDGFMQCTACGCIFDDHSTEYYFCPNCGADMRGEQE